MEETTVVRASLTERSLALLIDFVIIGIIFFTFAMPYIRATGKVFITGMFFNILFLVKDSLGRSPGKFITRIKVVRKDNLQNAGVWLNFKRNLYFFCLGAFDRQAIRSDEDHEGISDRRTNTMVVKTSRS